MGFLFPVAATGDISSAEPRVFKPILSGVARFPIFVKKSKKEWNSGSFGRLFWLICVYTCNPNPRWAPQPRQQPQTGAHRPLSTSWQWSVAGCQCSTAVCRLHCELLLLLAQVAHCCSGSDITSSFLLLRSRKLIPPDVSQPRKRWFGERLNRDTSSPVCGSNSTKSPPACGWSFT